MLTEVAGDMKQEAVAALRDKVVSCLGSRSNCMQLHTFGGGDPSDSV